MRQTERSLAKGHAASKAVRRDISRSAETVRGSARDAVERIPAHASTGSEIVKKSLIHIFATIFFNELQITKLIFSQPLSTSHLDAEQRAKDTRGCYRGVGKFLLVPSEVEAWGI
jgi:hypothetical protein